MTTVTVTIEELPGGTFIGGGADTLALSGDRGMYFELTQATIRGFTTLIADDDFRITMTSEQLSGFQTLEAANHGYLAILGSTIDLRGKTFTRFGTINVDDDVTVLASSLTEVQRVNVMYTAGDTLHFFGTLTETDRKNAHLVGYDFVVDDTGVRTENPCPTVENLFGERQPVLSGTFVKIDLNGDAAITDDQGPIRRLDIKAASSDDSIRILSTDRLTLAQHDFSLYDVMLDGVKIGTCSKNFHIGTGLSFSFLDTATKADVEYILHNVEFLRGAHSTYDDIVTITAFDRGGRITEGSVVMEGPDGPPHTPENRPPSEPSLPVVAISEEMKPGTHIGSLFSYDPDGDEVICTLDTDYGGLFRVEGDTLVLARRLDYEQRSSYSFQVTASDGRGGVSRATVWLRIADIVGETNSGTDASEKILGGKGNDTLSGSVGDDTLGGGTERDVLTGGAGRDAFIFDTKITTKTCKKHMDRIVDFKVKEDSIWLENSVFKKLGRKGSVDHPAKLNKAFFAVGDHAKDKNDYLIYDKKKGYLYYDDDGAGAHKAVVIATLSKHLKMTYDEIFVI